MTANFPLELDLLLSGIYSSFSAEYLFLLCREDLEGGPPSRRKSMVFIVGYWELA